MTAGFMNFLERLFLQLCAHPKGQKGIVVLKPAFPKNKSESQYCLIFGSWLL
jgi:hypothetical protein